MNVRLSDLAVNDPLAAQEVAIVIHVLSEDEK